MSLRLVAAFLCSSAVAGCGGERESASQPTVAVPVATLDPCRSVRPAALRPPEEVPGLIHPPGTVAGTIVRREDGATQVEGFLPLTPSAFLREADRLRGVDVLFRENEGRESEALLSDGRRRNFWKVLAACPQGSKFLAVIIEEPDRPRRPRRRR